MWFCKVFKRTIVQTELDWWFDLVDDPNPHNFVASIHYQGSKVGAAQGCFRKNFPFTVERFDVFGNFKNRGFGTYEIKQILKLLISTPPSVRS